MTKAKIFLQVILEHSKDPKKVKRILGSDRRLSQDEKNIVWGFLAIRDNENAEALKMGQVIRKQDDATVDALRLYLIGGSLNNLGQFKEAQKYFEECFERLPKNESPHLEYVVLHNLFSIAYNQGDRDRLAKTLKEMDQIQELNEEDQLLLLKSHLNFYIYIGHRPEADRYFQSLWTKRDQFSHQDFVALQMDFFSYGVVFERYEICEEALKELKVQKKYSLTQNFNYMKILLNHLKDGAPIYLSEASFEDYPKILWELKCIQSLEKHQWKEAEVFWAKLHGSYPSLYGENFHFLGPTCLFSRALEKNAPKLKTKNLQFEIPANYQTILDKIEYLLLNYEGITKEQIHFVLFNKEVEHKEDIVRITKYINKLKARNQWELQNARGALILKRQNTK